VTTHHPYHAPGEAAPADESTHFEGYRAAVRHTDRFAGELLAKLAAAGQLDDTLVFVLGDHGEAFGEHVRRQHDVVPYEEAVRVPMMLAGPDWLGAPRRIGGLRHHVDLLPTLLELLGAEWQGRLPGRSLLTSDGHESVWSSCWYDNWCLAVRTGNLKYVFHYGRRPAEVFDLSRDPGERADLSATLPAALKEAIERKLLAERFSIDAHYRANAPHRRADP
jgi:arylsulfatase A-like enzyme